MAIKATPSWWVLSEGMGVTSSICPIFRSWASRLLRGWLRPLPRSLGPLSSRGLEFDVDSHSAPILWPLGYIPGNQHSIWRWFISASLHLLTVTQEMASLPEGSVTWTDVSLKDAQMCNTTYMLSPATWGPNLKEKMACSSLLPFPLMKYHSTHLFQTLPPESCNLFFKHYLSGLDVFYFTVLKIKTGKVFIKLSKWLYFSAWVLPQIQIIYRSSYWFEGNVWCMKNTIILFYNYLFQHRITKRQ